MNNKIHLAFKLRNLFKIPKLYSSTVNNLPIVENVLDKSPNQEKIESINNILEPCKEDLSNITPALAPSFNFAPYLNNSPTLQQIAKLGVDLSRLEKRTNAREIILRLDFEKDVKKYISFLHDNGVPADSLGLYFTKNPFIFRESIEDLCVRINYLESKKFTPEMIGTVILKNPYWLNVSTNALDYRLGYFQKKFDLSGPEIRLMVCSYPKIVTTAQRKFEANNFVITEEMGFNENEIKLLLIKRPKLWVIRKQQLLARFDYLHNTIGLSHQQILDHPQGLANRLFRTRDRHEFLVHLCRAQYDPKKEGYISLDRLVTGSDQDFAINVAKSSEYNYMDFLRKK